MRNERHSRVCLVCNTLAVCRAICRWHALCIYTVAHVGPQECRKERKTMEKLFVIFVCVLCVACAEEQEQPVQPTLCFANFLVGNSSAKEKSVSIQFCGMTDCQSDETVLDDCVGSTRSDCNWRWCDNGTLDPVQYQLPYSIENEIVTIAGVSFQCKPVTLFAFELQHLTCQKLPKDYEPTAMTLFHIGSSGNNFQPEGFLFTKIGCYNSDILFVDNRPLFCKNCQIVRNYEPIEMSAFGSEPVIVTNGLAEYVVDENDDIVELADFLSTFENYTYSCDFRSN